MNLVTTYDFLNVSHHIPDLYHRGNQRSLHFRIINFKTVLTYLYRYQKVFSGPDMLLTLLCTISFQFS